MHPLIRLVSFIVFAAFVSVGNMASSLVGLSVLGVVWLITQSLPRPKAWIMIKRLRLFFISIFIMYLWFTPGELLWPLLDGWSPTAEGLTQGFMRVLALIILVLGVESLLRLTDRSGLLTGLFYLATPLKWVGIDRERFIIRVLLTLELVAEGPSMDMSIERPSTLKQISHYDDLKSNDGDGAWVIKKMTLVRAYLALISEKLADKFNVAAMHPVDVQMVECEIIALPHWIQWLIPLTITVVFITMQ